MFLEPVGRFLFGKIRLPFFFVLVAMAPVCVFTYLYFQKESAAQLQEQYDLARGKSKRALDRKDRRERFLSGHRDSDPFFLDKEIESYELLSEEKTKLKNWIAHPAIANKQLILSRLKFLDSKQNKLAFKDEDVQISKLYKETIEKQKHSVEMDGNDLKNLLGLIEGFSKIEMQRPQLIVTEFTCKKKTAPLRNEVLEIKLDLLKREFE